MSAASVQAADCGPASLRASHRFRLAADGFPDPLQIDVALPTAPMPAGALAPVIYVLDGNECFALTAQVARFLQAGPFPLPPAIVVGIGYWSETPADAARARHLRVRDLTPWVDHSVEARYRAAPPPYRLPDDVQQGGADAFGDLIEGQIKPFIASRFPVDPSDQTLVGVSLGGTFTLYTLLRRPSAFRRYVVSSPGLYWADRGLFDLEADYAARSSDLDASLFLAVGGLEEAMDPDTRFVSSLYEFDGRLRSRAYPNLKLGFHVFTDETHMSVTPAALSRGLTSVWGGHRATANWARVLKA